jgi:mannosyl-oligosaccharide glucosidase
MLPTASALLSAILLLSHPAVADQSLVDIERASNQSLLWGPYRPNLYFGVRPRVPESLLMGLMWAKVDDYQSVQNNFRHTCEQHEGMAGYGWERYDPRHGGIQTVHDAGNKIDITTSFFKDSSAGEKGGNWGVRVKGTPRSDAPPDLKSTMLFYTIMEGPPGLYNRLETKGSKEQLDEGFEGDVTIEGQHYALGEFKISIKGDAEDSENKHPSHDHPSRLEKSLEKTFVHSETLPAEALWQMKRKCPILPLIWEKHPVSVSSQNLC